MPTDIPDEAEEFARARLEALRRFAYAICSSVTEADDLAQIAMIEVWRRWARVRESPEAYARRVIVTRNVSRWRRFRREVPVSDVEPSVDDPASVTVDNPKLWQALRMLSSSERTVVVLHVFYEYTFAEIAAFVGEPQGTVSSRYARAKKRLRASLSRAGVTDPNHARVSEVTP